MVPVGQALSWHCSLPLKVSLQLGLVAQVAVTVMFAPQVQVAGTSTAQIPPELTIWALTGPPPQSISTVILAPKVGGQPICVPVTWMVAVVVPFITAGIPVTLVMLIKQGVAMLAPVGRDIRMVSTNSFEAVVWGSGVQL